MADAEFVPFPKIPRLFKEAVLTEKIDGTNAAIHFGGDSLGLEIVAQSRKRVITPEDDNFGFARWVYDNADALYECLGPGRHYGEWWGHGIQRGYGVAEKRFSLFNVARHADLDAVVGGVPLTIVPVLDMGPFSTLTVLAAQQLLREHGSQAAPGFMNPEGVMIYHTAAGLYFKSPFDPSPKGA